MPRKKRKPQKQQLARIQPHESEPIEKRISVFLSSDQIEFEDIRQDLKIDIESQAFGFTELFKVKLVESARSTKFRKDIRKSLSECDIYILIIGNEQSSITEEEYAIASDYGIPILVYLFLKRDTVDPKLQTCPTHKFLYAVVKPTVRIRGLDHAYRTYPRLRDDVLSDLAYVCTELLREDVEIRRVMSEAKV